MSRKTEADLGQRFTHFQQDEAVSRASVSLLADLNKEHGKTILTVTHDPHAARFAKTTRYMEKGVLLAEGKVPQHWMAFFNSYTIHADTGFMTTD